MQHQEVKSSSIKSIAYDHSSKKMHVRFSSGATYEYDDVPPEQHANFLNAPSVGAHFAAHIRPHFKSCKV